MVKKMKAFKGGGKIKRYAEGESVESNDNDIYAEARSRDRMRKSMEDQRPGQDFVLDTDASVRRALAGERPASPDFTQLPESKDNKFVNAVKKIQAKQADRRDMEAGTGRGSRPGVSQIPGQSLTQEQRDALNMGSRVTGTETSRNVSNALAALTPMGGGVGKIGAELAFGKGAGKVAQAANAESKLSPAGQRLANMEEVRRVAMPGRSEAVMNPSAWAGGPKAMDKIAQAEGRAAAAEARAAQAAAKKKAAQAKRDAKDPVMNARPGADKAKPASKYETDEPIDISFGYKRGGTVKKFAKGGSVSSASSRADGIAIRGKTKGTISKMCGGGMYKGKK